MTVIDRARAVGADRVRADAVAKVTGQAAYSAEIPIADRAYGAVVQSTIARGSVTAIDSAAVLAMPGVLWVLTADNAPTLEKGADCETFLLQSEEVRYRGEIVALVVAATFEQARAGADALVVTYDEQAHDATWDTSHPGLFSPETVNPSFPGQTSTGDVDTALATAAHVIDQTYSTPSEQNNPMEPHAATAEWTEAGLTVYDSTQGVASVRSALAALFALKPGQVRVLGDYVGGGFGSKGSLRPPAILAAIAARHLGRPVTVTLTRAQMFSLVGYRTPTVQRVRLGADQDGRLVAVDHTAYSQTSRLVDFAEQTAVISRLMYATPNVRTQHRLVRLDVPTPRWMRAPGEAPGSFALESAMDELAEAAGVDPVELRIVNDANREPEGGAEFSSRSLVECLRDGAERFGWRDRDPRPGVRVDGRWLIGSGVASATYPARSAPSTASIAAHPDDTFTVRIAAADIGTGARTALVAVAADELGVDPDRIQMEIADSDFGSAMIAGGSMGTASWSWAISKAARLLREQVLATPDSDVTVTANTAEDIEAMADLARYSFGAQFAEVRVDRDTGEVRVSRMTGVFAAGRIVNPRLARSQFLGGMTMGTGMALHEEAVMDGQFGDYVNHDLANYHVPVNADVPELDVAWVDEVDTRVNPLGIKGIGEIGIVGAAAAIANATWHATGFRIRDLPLRPDRVLAGLTG